MIKARINTNVQLQQSTCGGRFAIADRAADSIASIRPATLTNLAMPRQSMPLIFSLFVASWIFTVATVGGY